MAAKDNDIGTWSDWSVAVHATPWTEEPKHLTTEAQITGKSLHPVKTGFIQEEPRTPGLKDLLFGSAQVLSTAKGSPQTPMELQPVTLHCPPICGPVSR